MKLRNRSKAWNSMVNHSIALSALMLFVFSVPCFGQIDYPLDVGTFFQGDWTFSVPLFTGGRCYTPGPNPDETSASGNVSTPAGPGVKLVGQSSTCGCCSCAARSKSWRIDDLNTTVDAPRLQGWIETTRNASTFTIPMLQVDLLLDGIMVTNRGFGETRPNPSNCRGRLVNPMILPLPNGQFDIDMAAAFGRNIDFNEVRILLASYACCDGQNTIMLADTNIHVP